MGSVLSFLETDELELSNLARTAAYLPVGHRVRLVRKGFCSILLSELPAAPLSPVADPAPWFTSAVPESGEFLGFLLLDLDVSRKATRPAVVRVGGSGGFSVGTQQAEGQVLRAKGLLVASTGRGLAFGRLWLRSRLEANQCVPCSLGSARYREFCPAPGSPTSGVWLLYDVGLTGDGIAWGDSDPDGGQWQEVSFELSSQHAYRFRTPEVEDSGVLLSPTTEGLKLDFTTNPFGSDGLLVCSPTNRSGGPCAHVWTTFGGGGWLQAPVSAGYSSFYATGRNDLDGSITVKITTSDQPSTLIMRLAGRWINPHLNDGSSKAIMLELNTKSAQRFLHVYEGTAKSDSDSSIDLDHPGLQSTSALFPQLSPLTDYWLRLHLDGSLAVGQLWVEDPYDALGRLKSGILPLAETPWPPYVDPVVFPAPPNFEAHAMSTAAATRRGTWGVYDWRESFTTTHGRLDDLRLSAECMDFIRWFCEVPPTAVSEVLLQTERPGASVAAVVTFDATDGQIAHAFAEAYRGVCPPAAGSMPFARIDVPLLIAGSKLVVNSSTRRVVFTDPTGATYDGSGLLALPEGQGIGWLDAEVCNSPICVRAGVSSWCGTADNATVTVESQERST